jgi:flavin reductase (DIM6/NTAB) family NADH-FMN oxidoreductase RutF
MLENPAQLFKHLSCGVYVIGVKAGERQNAFTAAWVMQVSFNPPLLAISINPRNYSFQLMQAGGVCSVNVLSREQADVAEHFGKAGLADKMAGYRWQTAVTGAPVLLDGLAYFDCKVLHYAEAGDHKIAVCEVLAAKQLNTGLPLLYSLTGNMDGSDGLYGQKTRP